MFGIIFAINLNSLICIPGTIANLPFSSFSTVYFATYWLVKEFKLNFTPATLLIFVFTGPGCNTLICTFDFFFFNSSLIPSDNLKTYAFEE